MIVRAWAVVCKSGEMWRVHDNDEHVFLFTDRDMANEERHDLEEIEGCGCGPHKVVTLRGEVADARKK